MNDIEYKISPPRRLAFVDWSELWRYKDLFWVLAWRDITVRYKQTLLGTAWALIQPFVTMVVFTFVFNRVAGITSGDGTPYPIFLYSGLLFWQYFSSTVSGTSGSMVSNAPLIQKTYFPRLIIPASCAVTGLADFVIASMILVGMMIYYGFRPHLAGILILPILLVCTVMTALGMGLFLAALNVRYRDTRHAVPFFVQIMMYLTPVVYPVSMLKSHAWAKELMLWINPMSGVITSARAGITGKAPIDAHMLAISLLASAVLLCAGVCYFTSAEKNFADIL
ncbi:ABC transporter permease [bacterium]|nr:ABC transporter permease [bacterium]